MIKEIFEQGKKKLKKIGLELLVLELLVFVLETIIFSIKYMLICLAIIAVIIFGMTMITILTGFFR